MNYDPIDRPPSDDEQPDPPENDVDDNPEPTTWISDEDDEPIEYPIKNNGQE